MGFYNSALVAGASQKHKHMQVVGYIMTIVHSQTHLLVQSLTQTLTHSSTHSLTHPLFTITKLSPSSSSLPPSSPAGSSELHRCPTNSLRHPRPPYRRRDRAQDRFGGMETLHTARRDAVPQQLQQQSRHYCRRQW